MLYLEHDGKRATGFLQFPQDFKEKEKKFYKYLIYLE